MLCLRGGGTNNERDQMLDEILAVARNLDSNVNRLDHRIAVQNELLMRRLNEIEERIGRFEEQTNARLNDVARKLKINYCLNAVIWMDNFAASTVARLLANVATFFGGEFAFETWQNVTRHFRR
ncbi:hypothetical protein M3Y98_00777900 [Aphelenchoides besseyi]|nr:hypothetical protein M3Y98_00777900 [Aphelenchoides besseyi]